MDSRFGSARSREDGVKKNLNIKCFREPCSGGLSLHIEGKCEDKFLVADDFLFKEIGLFEEASPALIINETEAQGLMESLWQAGIRPKSGEGSVGQLGATERHLNDMRAMVAVYSKTTLP